MYYIIMIKLFFILFNDYLCIGRSSGINNLFSYGYYYFTQNGVPIPMTVKEGDLVALPPFHQGNEIKLNGETYLVLRESDLLMVITETE